MSGAAARIESRLKHLVTQTITTAPGRALRRAIQATCWLVEPLPGKPERLAELSVGYVARGASVGEHAARLGLGLMFDVIGWAKLTPYQARSAGFALRRLDGGARGPLRIITPEAFSALLRVQRWLGRESLRIGSRPGAWEALSPTELRARGYSPVQEHRGRKVRCPMHSDTSPSLILFGGGAAGAAYCHGGCGSASWTTGTDRQKWVRVAAHTAPVDQYRSTIVRGPRKRRLPAVNERVSCRPRGLVDGLPGQRLDEDSLSGFAGYVSATRGDRFKRAWCSPVLETLCWADRDGPAAATAAQTAGMIVASGRAEASACLPDRFLSVSPMRALSGVLRLVGPASTPIAMPTSWGPDSQEWVLVDLDDFDSEALWHEQAFAAHAAALAESDPWLTGRMAVVRTSDTGLQIWLELDEVQRDPRSWWRTLKVKQWHARVSGRLLDAARSCGLSGGTADATAAAPGRYGRRPGWRLVDGLWPFRSRVIAVVADAGRPPCSAKEARRALTAKRRI